MSGDEYIQAVNQATTDLLGTGIDPYEILTVTVSAGIGTSVLLTLKGWESLGVEPDDVRIVGFQRTGPQTFTAEMTRKIGPVRVTAYRDVGEAEAVDLLRGGKAAA